MSGVPSQPSRPLQYAKAIARSGLPSGVKATCWAIATFANNNTGRAYPTVKKIAEAVGLSAETVSKHTARAEAEGYLRKERKYNSSIDYYITVPIPVMGNSTLARDVRVAKEAPALRITHETWRGDPDAYF